MLKGKGVEKGLTHRMTPTEIEEIESYFSGLPFQLQVRRDLRGAKYKLYDAIGMWLDSKPYLDEVTYGVVQTVSLDFLEDRLVPGYYKRCQARSNYRT